MSKADAWMPLHIGPYLADTMHLRAAEHGAYMLLLMHYWRNGPLPDDDRKLSGIARMTLKEWAEVSPTIREFFSADAGRLHQRRADAERAKSQQISNKRADAARSSHVQRGSKCDANAHANAEQKHTHARVAIPKPIPIPRKEERKEDLAPLRDAQPDLPEPVVIPDRSPNPRRSRLKADWQPSEQDHAFAAERGVSADAEAEKFRDYHLGRGTVMADWSAAWRTWVGNSLKFAGQNRGAPRGKRTGLNLFVDTMRRSDGSDAGPVIDMEEAA